MGVLTVEVPNKTYDVVIEQNVYERLQTDYASLLKRADRVGIIADEFVYETYGDTLVEIVQSVQPNVSVYEVPKGESCKTLAVYGDIQSFLLKEGLTRNSILLAFGGGAVGDLTGFVAATYMRGIPFIQLPTTILAHDSAVGGKTAINLPEGKNMVGAFHQPEAVLFDLNVFKSLPAREWRSGMAELIKHAYISDAAWTEQLLAEPKFAQPAFETLESELLRGVRVKADIVREDTFEHGARKFLNFGHTFGHAVEAATHFGELSHGECVMIGMGYALVLSETLGSIDEGEATRFIQFAKEQGYSFDPIFDHSFDHFLSYMQKDKKASFGELYFVILETIGTPRVVNVDVATCEQTFQTLQTIVKG